MMYPPPMDTTTTNTPPPVAFLLDDIRSLALDRATLNAHVAALTAERDQLRTDLTSTMARLNEVAEAYSELYGRLLDNDPTTLEAEPSEENQP